MRVNVFSPLSYTWERFAELQYQYALARQRIEFRHFDRLYEARANERINEAIIKKEIANDKAFEKQTQNLIMNREILKKMLDRELTRIRYEREFLEKLYFIGKQIREHSASIRMMRKVALDRYLLGMKIESEERLQKDLLIKQETKKLDIIKKEKI